MERLVLLLGLLIITCGCVETTTPATTSTSIVTLPTISTTIITTTTTAIPELSLQLTFYDGNTNCPLDGTLEFNRSIAGKTIGGKFYLTWADYEKYRRHSDFVCLYGRLSTCFGNYTGRIFDACWKFNITLSDFTTYSFIPYDGEVSYRIEHGIPYRREMMNFITPDDVKPFLLEIEKYFKNNDTLDNLGKINEFVPLRQYIVEDYWKMPKETIKQEYGDCKAFSTVELSLIKAYNNSLKCFNLVLSNHLTTMCKFTDIYPYDMYIIYDQAKMRPSETMYNANTKREKITLLRTLFNNYIDAYGLDPDTKISYAFSNEDFEEFHSNDDFFDWILSV
ncbi:MAG: hypothetical protein NT129_06490 [Candidatus Aenigmarchaeota archaeon]|nr:hypothetical protein [Candidatus Aenigmarchaeota archaeon]